MILLKRITVFAIALTMVACGGEKSDDAKEGDKESKKKIEVSAEMKDFISGFNGNFEVVEEALMKHGANEEIQNHDMGMYDLDDPEILSSDGDCYELKTKSGMVENYYTICWEEGKIISIEEKLAQ